MKTEYFNDGKVVIEWSRGGRVATVTGAAASGKTRWIQQQMAARDKVGKRCLHVFDPPPGPAEIDLMARDNDFVFIEVQAGWLDQVKREVRS